VDDGAARWDRLRHIIAEASDLLPGEQAGYVARACGGDDRLRAHVLALLQNDAAGQYLEGLASRAGLPFAGADDAPPAGMERVGAYRLVRRIGEGGMGSVYLADRADGAFEMRVAVKLLTSGFHTEMTQRRFATERRILARLAHPGICRLLDGGVTDTGVPFLVMEYAAGTPIDTYCDDSRLDIDSRLALFLQVCEAVEFAHSHGVVHRDLKPTNILVSADARVKLLDFGIAKVLDGTAATDSTLTAWAGTPLTPSYASPEQIMGEAVGFGSDVYQLATLLYFLLTGRQSSDSIDGGSWAERARAVRSRRVIPASMAVGMPGQLRDGRTAPGGEQRARLRRTSVPALRSRLAGDMDAILLKALRHQPDRRFGSVSAFAAEIRRYREGRPVAASLETFIRPSGLKHVEAAPSRPRPARDEIEHGSDPPARVAVLPFAVPPIEGLGYLRHGLVSLLATALDDSGLVSVCEPAAVLATLPSAEAAITDEGRARRWAEHLGAGLFVVGDVVQTGHSLRLTASLHETRHDREPRLVAVAEGTTDQVFELVDRLAIDLLCGLAPGHSAGLARAAAESASLPVFKLFVRGEQALHAGAFFAAADAFQRAVEADPHFALGYYRLATAAYWAHNLGLTRRFAVEAAARSERLPARERRLLAALELYLDGRASLAEESYAALLDENPGDLEAAFLLGTLLFFHNALRGRSHAEARPCFERVLAHQPNHILSLLYLSTIVTRAGDLPALDGLTERLLAVYPDGGLPAYPLVARAQHAFASGNPAAQDRILEELRHAGSLAALTACQVVVVPHRDLSGAGRIAQLLVAESEHDSQVRATGHVMRAHCELGRGRIGSAERELELAHALGSIEAREYRVLFALAPFRPVSVELLERLRANVLGGVGADPTDAPPPIPHFAPHHGVHAHVQLFLLGMLNARLGACDEALDQARELEAGRSASDDIALGSFAETIRAEVASSRGGPAEALAVWEKHELATSVERALSSSLYAHGHARFSRAELLRAVGREDEALAWYRTLGDNSVQDAIFLAPAQLRQAEIFRDRGAAQPAALHYRRFLNHWRDCDPELQPQVRAAALALARLEPPAPAGG
jgi:serine/threonine protein kinase/tetratricopeptide (TPR) repeat protein